MTTSTGKRQRPFHWYDGEVVRPVERISYFSTAISVCCSSHTCHCGCSCIPCLRGLFKGLIGITLTHTMYQQVETDDDDELRMDDGDEDADDVFKCKAVPYSLSEFSMKLNVC